MGRHILGKPRVEHRQADIQRLHSGGRGGFLHFDVGAARTLRTGPEVSWLSPDPPREGWLKTRVVTPGWGLWYTPTAAVPLAVGLSTSTRFVLTEQSATVVDLFTSQAHIALLLR